MSDPSITPEAVGELLANMASTFDSSRIVREASIGREKAKRILDSVDCGDLYDPMGDYFIAWDAAGREALTCWGQDHAIAHNLTTTSWL